MKDANPAGLLPGDPRQLGPYRILGRLGAGGMGTVFRADVSGTGGQVAVKTIHPAYSANHAYRSRFAREVAAASRVTSPYTSVVLDWELRADPLYVVTELVDGASLSDLVTARHRLAGEALVALARDTARALLDIHARDVVHRDLKPSNVMVAEDRTVLIDFGIAAHLDEIGELTSTGKVVGSLPYLAPELLGAGRASPASDVFSWGCVVYFAATGHAPFSGDAGTLVDRIRAEEADVRAVPGVVRDLVERALAKDARDRPSVPEILKDLDTATAEVVLCGDGGGSYVMRLRDFLADAGLPVRVSRQPDTLAEAAVLLTVVSDRPGTTVADMRSAARRLGLPVLVVAVGAGARPDAFLDARAGGMPGPAHLRRLRELARTPRTAPTEKARPMIEPVRAALTRGDLVAADQLTTTLLVDAAGCAELGWIGRAEVAAIETALLRDCARVWHDETGQSHGFLAQRVLFPGGDHCDIAELAPRYGWGAPGAVPADYHGWVADRGHQPGFFPTLRHAGATGNWFDRWSMTVSSVHERIRQEQW